MKFLFTACVLLSSHAFAQWNPSFHTRIHNKLAISGNVCHGGETTNGLDEEVCQKGQWLVNVDNINTCSDEGWCTEMAAPTFIAELDRANVITPATVGYFNIVAKSKLNTGVDKILKTYWVRDDFNGKAVVVKKRID